MLNNEPKLLKEVLHSIDGDLFRSRHVLLLYALTKILVGCESFDSRLQQMPVAAAILSEFPVSSCKAFLISCGYVPSYQSDILDLLAHEHKTQSEFKTAHQVLSEATILTDFVEGIWSGTQADAFLSRLKTESGRFLFHVLSS